MNDEMVLQIVNDINSTFSNPKRWIQGWLSKPGIPHKYCLLGAGQKHGYTSDEVAQALGFDSPSGVMYFNDFETRCFEDILALLNRRRCKALKVDPTPPERSIINAIMVPVFKAHSKNWKTYVGSPEVAPVMHDTHNFGLAGD